MSREVLTTTELAEYWGVSLQSVRHAAWRGLIPGCSERVTGQTTRYVFDKEVVLRDWVPPSIKKWASGRSAGSAAKADGQLSYQETARETAETRLRDLSAVVTSEDWAAIVLKAVDQAREGEWRARQWLGNYLMGTPIQRVAADVRVGIQEVLGPAERAAAVTALLQVVQGREEVEIVDLTPREVGSEATNS